MAGKNNPWASFHMWVSRQWRTEHFEMKCGSPAPAGPLCKREPLGLSKLSSPAKVGEREKVARVSNT